MAVRPVSRSAPRQGGAWRAPWYVSRYLSRVWDSRLGGNRGGAWGTHTFRACPAPPHTRTARPLHADTEKRVSYRPSWPAARVRSHGGITHNVVRYLLLVISLTWHTTIASTLPRRPAPLSRGGARVRRADSGFSGGYSRSEFRFRFRFTVHILASTTHSTIHRSYLGTVDSLDWSRVEI